MPDSQVSIRRTKVIPDYTAEKQHARVLAENVQQYYHNQGHKDVKCWVEPSITAGGTTVWGVKSNLVFDVRTLTGKII